LCIGIFKKSITEARFLRLISIIPATQEAEIRKIKVQSQPGQIVHQTLSWKYPTENRDGEVAQVVKSASLASMRP
jgi:hypothetical protein